MRTGEERGKKEREHLVGGLGRRGLLPIDGTTLDDVLALDVEAIPSRRLQALTFLKGLPFTPRQARQFIVHGHVSIAGRRVTIPGILVSRTEENGITYDERSAISSDLHPVRQTGQIPTPPPAAGGAEEGPEDEPGPETPGPPPGPSKEA